MTMAGDALRRERLAKMKSLGIVPDETTLPPRSECYDWGETTGVKNPSWDSLPKDRRSDLARRMAIYAAMVDRMDQNVGRVLDELRKGNELDNTLIVFTSDNGACAEWDAFGFDIKSGVDNTLHRGDEIERMARKARFIVSARAGPRPRPLHGACTSTSITKVALQCRALSIGPAISPALIRLIQPRPI